jgi:hypothetical protein
LLGFQCGRQFEQREGIACGLREEAFPHRGREVRRVRVKEFARRRVVQLFHVQVRDPSLCERALGSLAEGDQQDNRLGLHAARHERQRVTRGPVQPLRVLGDDEHWRMLCRPGEQLQGRQRDEKKRRRGIVGHAKGRLQRVMLWRGQGVGLVEDRSQELVEAGEGQLGFRLHPGGGQDAHALRIGSRAGRGEQRRLAHACLAVREKRRAVVADAVNQLIEPTFRTSAWLEFCIFT